MEQRNYIEPSVTVRPSPRLSGTRQNEEARLNTTMYTVDETGHTTVTYDDQEAVRQEFERQQELGFIAFAGDDIDTELVLMRRFVPGFAAIYWVRPLVGG